MEGGDRREESVLILLSMNEHCTQTTSGVADQETGVEIW